MPRSQRDMNTVFYNAALAFSIFLATTSANATEDCKLCHIRKVQKFVPEKRSPKREHSGFSLKHTRGEISCNSCHDAARSNYLRTSPEFPASFEMPSAVCQRCHSEVFTAWSAGSHGKISGGWADAPGISRKKSQCTDCHDPHSVSIKPVVPSKAPQRPKFSVPKGESHE